MGDDTLLLLDMGSIFWAAWHSSANDEISAARNRALGQVMSLRSTYPGLCAICCDSPKSWRKAEFPEYKANRTEKDKASIEELRATIQTLRADGVVCWESEGFEADDLLAAATAEARKRGLTVVVASADKDLLQLVGDGVTVVSTMTGVKFDRLQVVEKFGVAPDQMGDYLALVGDKSDNIPGVPGIGAMRAAELLMQYDDLAGIYRALGLEPNNIKPANGAALLECAGPIQTWRRLIQLRADAPLDFDALFREPEKVDAPAAVTETWDERIWEPEEKTVKETAEQEPSAPVNEAAISKPEPLRQTALATTVVHQDWSVQLEPTSTASAFTLAKHLHESRLYTQFPNHQAIFAVIMRGRSLGIDAATSLAAFHVIKGKVVMQADLVVGLVLKSGIAEYFDLVESTREKATYATKRRGARSESRLSWDMTDACAAGLVVKRGDGYEGRSQSGEPSNWDKYRRAMLRHRCSVDLARAVYPDVTMGLYTPDEATGGNGPIDSEFEEV